MTLLGDLGLTSAMEGGSESSPEVTRTREEWYGPVPPFVVWILSGRSIWLCKIKFKKQGVVRGRGKKKKKLPESQGHLPRCLQPRSLVQLPQLPYLFSELHWMDLRDYLQKILHQFQGRRWAPHEQTQMCHWKLLGGLKARALKYYGNVGQISGRMEVRSWLDLRTEWKNRREIGLEDQGLRKREGL